MSDEYELDGFEVDDFDLGDDTLNPDAPKADREPITVVTKSFASAALETLKNPEVLKDTILTALPDGYSDATDVADDVVYQARDLYDTTARELKPAIRDFKRSIRTMLPKKGGMLPDGLIDRLDNLTQVEDESDTSGQRRVDVEQSAVNLGLSELLRAQEHYAQQDYDQNLTNRVYDLKNQKESTTATLERLDGIRSAMNRLIGFNDNVANVQKRKSVELQYRQLHVTQQQFALQQQHVATTKALLDSIVKNTGLPEYRKEQLGETSSSMLRRRMLAGVHGTFDDYTSKFGDNFRSNVRSRLDGIVTGVKDKIGTLKDMTDMAGQVSDTDIDPLETAGDIAGGMGTSYMMQLLAEQLKPILDKDGAVAKGGDQLAYYAANMPAIMNEIANGRMGDLRDEDGLDREITLLGKNFNLTDIARQFTSLIPAFSNNEAVYTANDEKLADASAFTNQTRKSIVEVIPGYLAKILKEVASLRAGGEVDREVYDYDRAGFVSESQYKDKLLAKFANQQNQSRITSVTQEIVKSHGSDLSEEAIAAFERVLLKNQVAGVMFSPETYSLPETYRTVKDDTLVDELTSFFAKSMEKENGGDHYYRRQGENMKRIKYLGHIMGDPRAGITESIKNGEGDMLRDLGLISNSTGKVDYTKDVEYMGKTDRLAQLQELGLIDKKRKVIPKVNEHIAKLESEGKGAVLRNLGLSRQGGSTVSVNYDGLIDSYRGETETASQLDQSIGLRRGLQSDNEETLTTVAPEMLEGIEINVKGIDEIIIGLNDAFAQIEQLGSGSMDGVLENLERLVEVTEDGRDWVNDLESKTGIDKTNEMLSDIIGILLDPPWNNGSVSSSNESGGESKHRSFMNGMKGRLGGMFKRKPKEDKSVRGFGDRVQKASMFQKVKSKLNPFSQGDIRDAEGNVVLSAKKLRNGEYYSFKTGKPIFNMKDIDGEVVDALGNSVLAEEDIENLEPKSRSIIAKAFGLYGRYVKGVYSVMGKVAKLPFTAATMIGKKIFGKKAPRVSDVYAKGNSAPLLKASVMKHGGYFDAQTGAVINSIDDIKGEVVDADGNVLLSYEDINAGLHDNKRQSIVVKAVKAGRAGVKAMFSPYRLAGRAGKALYRTVTKPKDVYVDGEEKPKLYANILQNGGYRSQQTGDTIKSFKDIDGPVIDSDDNIVLSNEDIQTGLVDRKGDQLKGMSDKLMSVAGSIADAGMMAARGMYKYTTGVYSAMGKIGMGAIGAVGGLMGMGRGGADSEQESNTVTKEQASKTNTLLTEIRDIVEKLLPEEVRKGSWQSRQDDEDDTAEPVAQPGGFSKKQDKKGSAAAAAAAAAAAGDDDGSGWSLTDTAAGGYLAAKAKGALGAVKSGAGRLLGAAKGGLSRVLSFGSRFVSGTAVRAVAAQGLRMAATAGAAAAGIITAPVAIAAGVVAAVGVAAYYGYKYYKNKQKEKSDFLGIRLKEYGADSSDFYDRVLELEGQFDKYVRRSEDGSTIQDPNGDLELAKLMKLFDTEDQQAFSVWFTRRFKPVYLTYHTAMAKVANNITLAEMDDSLTWEQKRQVLEMTKWESDSSDNPYLVQASPFEGQSIEVQPDTILTMRKAFKDEIADELKKETMEAKQPGSVKAMEQAERNKATGGSYLNMTAASTAAGSYSYGTQRPGSTTQRKNPVETTSVATGSVVAMTGRVELPSRKRVTMDAPVDRVRMYAYGLSPIISKHARAIDALESATQPFMGIDSKGTVSFNGDKGKVAVKVLPLFGITEQSERAYNDWLQWFELRFLPVYIAYLSAMKQAAGLSISKAKSMMLSNEHALTVAHAIIGATGEGEDGPYNIWPLTVSPFVGWKMVTSSSMAEHELHKLEAAIAKRERNKANAGVPSNIVDFNQAKAEILPRTTEATRTTQDFTPPYRGTPGGNNVSVQDKVVVPFRPTDSSPVVSHPGGGTGGDVNELPESQGDGSWAAHKDLILAASEMAGVDSGLMATMASIESGFRGSVKASTSSATGLYQFINSTWKDMLRKYGPKYGIAEDTPRTDTRANTLMGAEYLKENQNYLTKKLGRGVSATDLYLAHFLGAGGAGKLLNADQDSIAADTNPAAAKANRSIFYNRHGRSRTLGEVYGEIDRRVRNHSVRFTDLGGSANVQDNEDVSTPEVTTAPIDAPASTTADVTVAEESKAPVNTKPITTAPAMDVASGTPSATTAGTPSTPDSVGVIDTSDIEVAAHSVVARKKAETVEQQQVTSERVIANDTKAQQQTLVESLEVQRTMASTLSIIAEKISNLDARDSMRAEVEIEKAEVQAKADKKAPSKVSGNRPTARQTKTAPISMKRVS